MRTALQLSLLLFLGACTGTGASSSSSSSSSSGGTSSSSSGGASSLVASSSRPGSSSASPASSAMGSSSSGSCEEACGVGCPAPQYWVCAANQQRYCNACQAACAGTTVVPCDFADAGFTNPGDAGVGSCQGAGGACVAVVPNNCTNGIIVGELSCGGGLGVTCCVPNSQCAPVCLNAGTSSEGWFNSCTSELVCAAQCAGESARCDNIGTRSEGWYTAGGAGCGMGGGLIGWTQCAPPG